MKIEIKLIRSQAVPSPRKKTLMRIAALLALLALVLAIPASAKYVGEGSAVFSTQLDSAVYTGTAPITVTGTAIGLNTATSIAAAGSTTGRPATDTAVRSAINSAVTNIQVGWYGGDYSFGQVFWDNCLAPKVPAEVGYYDCNITFGFYGSGTNCYFFVFSRVQRVSATQIQLFGMGFQNNFAAIYNRLTINSDYSAYPSLYNSNTALSTNISGLGGGWVSLNGWISPIRYDNWS